jgi:hypothetical protein
MPVEGGASDAPDLLNSHRIGGYSDRVFCPPPPIRNPLETLKWGWRTVALDTAVRACLPVEVRPYV